jgi:hypothetical protein
VRSAAARARGVVRARERAAARSARRASLLVERVDEDAGLGRDELRRAADPRRDDRAAARHRLEQRLAERLDQARPADDVARRRASAGLVVRDAADELDAGPPSSCARSGPSPTNVSVPSPSRANASASRTTFLRSVSEPTQRKRDAAVRRRQRRGSARGRRRVDTSSCRAPRDLRLELAPQVVGDAITATRGARRSAKRCSIVAQDRRRVVRRVVDDEVARAGPGEDERRDARARAPLVVRAGRRRPGPAAETWSHWPPNSS